MTTAASEINAAMAMLNSGKWGDAEVAFRRWVERHGANSNVEHMLALSLHAQGRSEESLPWFRRATSTATGKPAVLWNNYAAALLAVGNATQASEFARKAVDAEPGRAGAWLNLGLACEVQRRFVAATQALEAALKIVPNLRGAMRALARCRLRLGDAATALAALADIPLNTDATTDLIRCEAWIASEDYSAADAALDRLCADAAVAADALVLKAQLATRRGHGNQALEFLEEALHIDLENRSATVLLATSLLDRAEIDAGLSRLRQWLDRHPEDQSAASIYLVACNYSESFDPAKLLAEHQRLRPAPLSVDPWPSGWPQRRESAPMRVAWVAANFGVGPVEIFFSEILHSLLAGTSNIEHRLYAVGHGSMLATPSESWAANQIDVSHLNDEQLVEAIRADANDIAIDMIGRATGNRLSVFAARVAPVQVGWLDVFNPAGIDAMDYLVTDEHLSRPGADAHFTEKLIRLPCGRVAYNPPPAEAPSLEGVSGKRFVSFNRFSKLNDSVLDAWSRILRALPDWTLDLRARGGGDEDLAEHFRRKFEKRGVDGCRVNFSDAGPYSEAMEAYQNAAIALDPFPFNGCSTTCDALWMGLPVVTWPRDTIAGRQSAALLEFCGLGEWIAKDEESYVDIALQLARDEQFRSEWRARARDQLRPVLCDSGRFAREMVDAFRSISRRVLRPTQ